MSGKRTAWLLVAVAVIGVTAGAVPLEPTAGLFSDTSTFEDNHVGAAESWDRVALATDTPDAVNVSEDATLEVAVENEGSGPHATECAIVVDGETVETNSIVLEEGETWTASYEFDTSEAAEIDWEVTVDEESEDGTLTVEDGAGDEETEDGEGEE